MNSKLKSNHLPEQAGVKDYQEIHKYISDHKDEYISEIQNFLRLPGISTTGEGIQESARRAAEYIAMLGSDVEVHQTAGWPIVFGRLNSKRPDAKTIIAYSLYDVTPVFPEEWVSPPFEANILPAGALDLPDHIGDVICARGSVNQRGPMLAFILALKVMQEVTGDIPVNVIWLWEGEEEIGSPNLKPFIDKHHDEFLDADAFYLPSMRQNWMGSMVLNRGYKGLVLLELTCIGGDWGGNTQGRHLWGGHVLWVDAPLMRLTHAIASLYDGNQDITLDGLMDLLEPLNSEDVADLQEIERKFSAEHEAMFKQLMGVSKFKGGRTAKELITHFLTGASVNIEGIIGGHTGPAYFTHLPQSATAKMEFKLPPGPTADDLVRCLRAHLDARGFTEIEIRNVAGYGSCHSSMDNDAIEAAARAAGMHGVDCFVWPSANTACPGHYFNEAPLDLPVVFAGLGHGERYHQSNEYIEVDGIVRNMQYVVTFLNEWATS